MNSFLGAAALSAGGVLASPALAATATFIDFTIEITSREFAGDDPLFDGKSVGDSFDGALSVIFPVEDQLTFETDEGSFLLETLSIDGFDPAFFIAPRVALTSVFGNRLISGGFLVGDVRSSVSLESDDLPGLDDDPNELTLDELLALLTGAESARFRTSSSAGAGSLDFEVTGASVRQHPTPQVIPLPAAGWLMLGGLGALAALRRRPQRGA